MATKGMSYLSSDDSSYVMVAAIDFGTTFSGYAFSFQSDPTAIRMNKSWGENVGFQAYKTPTCVLTSGDCKFEAFGYDAEDRYAEVEEDEDEKETLHLYKHFKMLLHSEGKLTRDAKICSVNGTIAPAIDIFAMSIGYLKNHLLKAVGKSATRLDESQIKWILTVPAIWREEAKQFMREAAVKADLIPCNDSKQLSVCLEPEAASILCRNSEISQFTEASDSTDVSFKTGTKYIILDAGGGTIDITVHEVLITGNVKELHRATGGPWGGTKVDQNFVALLQDVLGKNFIKAFQNECPRQWFRFMVQFEKLKRAVAPDGKSKISIDLPWSMSNMYMSRHGKGIDKVLKEKAQLGVGFSNGVLIIKAEAVKSLFGRVIHDIVSHLQELKRSPKVIDAKFILLVGGFAESAYLQDSIKKECGSHMQVLIPSDAQMAVIKGAVLFGHKPTSIEARIARKTYGCQVEPNCKEGEHDHKYTYINKEGQLKCRLFNKFVSKGNEIHMGKKLTFSLAPSYSSQTKIFIKIKSTDLDEVTYAEEHGVDYLGGFTILSPDTSRGEDRSIKLDVTFGGTEIKIEGTDVTSGHTAKTVIDFLSE